MSEADAERQELLVHLHFDAKYRVEDIEGLFGAADADDADDEVEGNYKRQDLLKMHAYRDAIKRSQGAYVLYPGRSNGPVRFQGFHEILPGLGAFGVAPDENGSAQGLESLEKFLDEVLAHLGNQTTAQERVSYHIAESYTFEEEPVPYGSGSMNWLGRMRCVWRAEFGRFYPDDIQGELDRRASVLNRFPFHFWRFIRSSVTFLLCKAA